MFLFDIFFPLSGELYLPKGSGTDFDLFYGGLVCGPRERWSMGCFFIVPHVRWLESETGELGAQNSLSLPLAFSLLALGPRGTLALHLARGLSHLSFWLEVFLKKFSALSGEPVGGSDEARVRGFFQLLLFLLRRQLQAFHADITFSYKPLEETQRYVLLAVHLDG